MPSLTGIVTRGFGCGSTPLHPSLSVEFGQGSPLPTSYYLASVTHSCARAPAGSPPQDSFSTVELRGLALSAGSGQRASLPVEPMAFLDGFYLALEGNQAPDFMDDLEQAVSIVDCAVTRQGLSLQFDAGKTEAVVCSEDAASSCFHQPPHCL